MIEYLKENYKIKTKKEMAKELDIDGNKLNNDISNLCLLSRSEHAKLHNNLGICKKCQ